MEQLAGSTVLPASTGRPLSLAHLRAAVRGYHAELRRPSGARRSGAGPDATVRLDGARLQPDRRRVPGGLCHRPRERRCAHRQARHSPGLRAGHLCLESGGDEPCPRGQCVAGFAAARFLLGLGEAGNFPAAIKTVAEWFPRRERAFATGLFNSGSNVGAILAPLAVPIIAVTWGWQAAFLFTGVLSAIWLVTWLSVYRSPTEHPKLSSEELGFIRSDPDEPATRLPWTQLLRHRQAWAFRRREVPHRSDLVVLSLLAAEIPEQRVRAHAHGARAAAHRDLPSRGCREHRGRMACRAVHQARMEREPGAQGGDAGLRAGGGSNRVRIVR